ncbi:molybdate-anion transporter isoform X1 [Numida meleagris]|uniref:molybdate-anion transporter isoform X1 n=2 Tax=Numida meleagris TaxID=8996 RepID=UPI000B3DAC46|nr:molybdate-anion transporter isoform X1 [Numida meleagris]
MRAKMAAPMAAPDGSGSGPRDARPRAMLLAAYTSLAALLAAALGLELFSRRAAAPATNPAFARFQHHFLRAYLPALAADWLQGPYLYKLYRHYRFVEGQIAILYVCGFASAVLLGPPAASLVDRLGRRASCVLFSLSCAACCLTKLSRDYLVLAAGRVLGGLATALLFSAFEAWYVHEHVERHDFPAEWLAGTFARVAFWNNVLAVGAGVVATALAEWLGLGPVAPFVAAIPLLALAAALALKDWEENHGPPRALAKTCGDGLRCLLADGRVLLLGTVQALFESVVYIFIFLWTPVLDPHGPPLGIVFSSFMAASMLGSALQRVAVSARYRLQPVHLLALAVLLAFLSLFMLTFSTGPGQESPAESFLAFLLLELACGLYFPSMGFLRRKVIPEKERAGVLHWFRVPLNLLACLGLLLLHGSDHRSGTRSIFALCAALMLLALLAVGRLFAVGRHDPELRLPPPQGPPEGPE